MSNDRMPPIPSDQWSNAQRTYAQEIINGPRKGLISPFIPLLRSPELMAHTQRMGEYLRYRSAIGLRLSELAILITSKEWSQDVEWSIHAPIAELAGVPSSTIAAIEAGIRPEDMPPDDALVFDFSMELHRNRAVSDNTWAASIRRFGEHGTVDLIGINGYYSFLAMVMNAARTPLPAQ